MITQKIKTSEILKSEKYAIRITTLEQAKRLVPIYKKFNDLKFFFENDKNHSEYIGMRFTMNKGFHLYFVHPEGKTIVEYEDIDIDYE
jgi:hypothetical protein